MDNTMTFADILQKSFIAMSMGGTDRITTINILANVIISFLVGLFIFHIYKRTFQGVLYQRSFNMSLVLVTTVTTLVIMTISGNLVLSLGMVGALSIVRFRTPVKDSMDLVFLFWAISVGIANGVAYYNISIIGSILIAAFLFFLNRPGKPGEQAYLLVLQMGPDDNEKEVLDAVQAAVSEIAIKSKVVSEVSKELTIEVRFAGANSSFVDGLRKDGLVKRATLVTYDQDMSAA